MDTSDPAETEYDREHAFLGFVLIGLIWAFGLFIGYVLWGG